MPESSSIKSKSNSNIDHVMPSFYSHPRFNYNRSEKISNLKNQYRQHLYINSNNTEKFRQYPQNY